MAIGLLLAAATLPALSWLGIPLGVAVGVGTAWWWGAITQRRLADRGPELLATLRVPV